MLAGRKADELMCEVRTREMLEGDLVQKLQPTLAAYGLTIGGVRLADFGGQAIDYIREKLGDISRMNREVEINRRLCDALREEKVSAFRDAALAALERPAKLDSTTLAAEQARLERRLVRRGSVRDL